MSQPQQKFSHPDVTLDGSPRARVSFHGLETLWFNTGTLCNITCENCYILSSPKNDALVYLTLSDVTLYLDEIAALNLPVKEIGITGGEPFMNPDILPILEACLSRGFKVLLLTNAMQPMQRPRIKTGLLSLQQKYGDQLTMRISIDHFDESKHEEERGMGTWTPTINGLQWLAQNGFQIDIAGRTRWGENEMELRAGYAALFDCLDIQLDAQNPKTLMLFPEMDEAVEVPEITDACWDILDVSPKDMMCSNSRMVVKRKGAAKPTVLACTLLAYDDAFEMGMSLEDAQQPVSLNHKTCAKFCVLGGGACSVAE